VTAATALVVAIAGLVTALTQFNADTERSQATSATSAETSSPSATLEGGSQQQLRSHIPGSIRESCGRPNDPEDAAAAALDCKLPQTKAIQYNLFTSSDEMEDTYGDVKHRFDVAGTLTGNSCAAGDYEGVYRVDGRAVGHLLCFLYENDKRAAIVWTDRRVDILSFAWREDRNLHSLFNAWEGGVGPDA
jgi:hypothetical protein